MVSASLQLRAEFLLEQVKAIEDSYGEGRSEQEAESSVTATDSLNESSATRASSPLPADSSLSFKAMKQILSNARLRERKLETEVAYLKKALADAEALNSSLEIRLLKSSSEKQAEIDDEEDNVKIEKHLNDLLVGRSQAVKENYELRMKLLQTCDACYDSLQYDNFESETKPKSQTSSPTWRNVAEKMVRDISDNAATSELRSTRSLSNSPRRRNGNQLFPDRKKTTGISASMSDIVTS